MQVGGLTGVIPSLAISTSHSWAVRAGIVRWCSSSVARLLLSSKAVELEMATEEQKKVDVCQAQERPKEQIVDPWKAVAAEGKDTIDYDKLIGRHYNLEK